MKQPEPKTLERALKLFPGITASAGYFDGRWQFALASDKLFIHDKTRWRKAWREAFREAWSRYRRYDFPEWDIGFACAKKGVTAQDVFRKVMARKKV